MSDGDYDYLHTFDSFIEPPDITADEIMFYIRNILIFPGHPLNLDNEPLPIARCRFMYYGVTHSRRTIHLYHTDTSIKMIVGEQHIVDIDTVSSVDKTNKYYVDGVFLKPRGWINWWIRCHSFALIL